MLHLVWAVIGPAMTLVAVREFRHPRRLLESQDTFMMSLVLLIGVAMTTTGWRYFL